jgi:dihydropyrimidine dehydrogenase (NADP+)
MVMELATVMFGGGSGAPIPENGQPALPAEFPDRTLSAIGGVETGDDAAQFLLLGASTVQVCTGVMIHGYKLAADLCKGLAAFMERHGFETIEDFRGRSLEYFTTHAELVRRQAEVKASEKAARAGMVTEDTAWEGETFVEQSDKLVSND